GAVMLIFIFLGLRVQNLFFYSIIRKKKYVASGPKQLLCIAKTEPH
ncbi:conserved hypothetical protein, partial [Listeria monocytogenes FSL F2-208]